MNRLGELGISPTPWKTICKDYNDGRVWSVEAYNGAGIAEFDCNEEQFGFEEGFANAHLIAAMPKLYAKAYEVAKKLRIRLAARTPYITMNSAGIEAIVKDLEDVLAEATGEREV